MNTSPPCHHFSARCRKLPFVSCWPALCLCCAGFFLLLIPGGWGQEVSGKGGFIVRTEPEGAILQLGDLPPRRSPAIFADLPFGSFTLLISLEGYEKSMMQIRVDSQNLKMLDGIKLNRLRGNLMLLSEPDAVSWEIIELPPDSPEVPLTGRTPAVLSDVPAGEYAVRFFGPFLEAQTMRGQVVPRDSSRLFARMTLARESSPLAELNESPDPIEPATSATAEIPEASPAYPVATPDRRTESKKAPPSDLPQEKKAETAEKTSYTAIRTGETVASVPPTPAIETPPVPVPPTPSREALPEPRPAPVKPGPVVSTAEPVKVTPAMSPRETNPRRETTPPPEPPAPRLPEPPVESTVRQAVDPVKPASEVALPAPEPSEAPGFAGRTWPPAGSVQKENVHFEIGSGKILEMVWIPAGSFTMGSNSSENGHRRDEAPPTPVTLTSGFWIGKFEVTQDQWLAVMDQLPANFRGDLERPVESVSWEDAIAFCAALNTRLGNDPRLPAGARFTLPTEAQWEFACRAWTRSAYHSGDSEADLQNLGWFYKNSRKGPQAVGGKQPNAFGLYDMHGNVSEWCLDFYAPYSGQPVSDPQGPSDGIRKVYRGGSWYDPGKNCRSATRFSDRIFATFDVVGLRVVLNP